MLMSSTEGDGLKGDGRKSEGPETYSRSVPDAHHVMSSADVSRAVRRIAHELIERNHGLGELVIVGIQHGGVWMAKALHSALIEIEPAATIPMGSLDVSFHRDDINLRPVRAAGVSAISESVTDKTVVLVDDVLYTGRTVRAALDALGTFGRPRQVQLAVMVDRGHRELPLRADYVGKNLPTSRDEQVAATLDGVVILK
jgi:pyrimidine operon attenuation protein / uracil phosphoribosyltransferase